MRTKCVLKTNRLQDSKTGFVTLELLFQQPAKAFSCCYTVRVPHPELCTPSRQLFRRQLLVTANSVAIEMKLFGTLTLRPGFATSPQRQKR